VAEAGPEDCAIGVGVDRAPGLPEFRKMPGKVNSATAATTRASKATTRGDMLGIRIRVLSVG